MLCAVISARRGLEVLVLEPERRLGRKLRITGKGRCNLTNACEVREFLENVPRNPKFLQSSLYRFPPSEAMAFFEGLGLPSRWSAAAACSCLGFGERRGRHVGAGALERGSACA
jgi:predicted flavoprotein YhiN